MQKQRDGRDELNLAEFPISLLADRASPGQKTISVEDEVPDRESGGTIRRALTVTGSDLYGLPTSGDDDVLVGLLALSKAAGFNSPQLAFTRYDLIRTIGWPTCGYRYRRVAESLKRWASVTLFYENAWRDHQVKKWSSHTFHVLEEVKLNGDAGRTPDDEPLSYVVWNGVVWRSFAASYIKPLDLGLYFGLRTPTSKRLYRYLDKWLWRRERIHFGLHRFATNKIGMSPGYDAAQIRRKLRPAIEELTGLGFLAEMGDAQRYERLGKGNWRVNFVRGGSGIEAVEPLPLLDHDDSATVESLLIGQGVTAKAAAELASHGMPYVEEKIAIVSWLCQKKPGFYTNPAGLLIKAIREDMPKPPGMKPKPSPAPPAPLATIQEADWKVYWNELSEPEQVALDAQVLASLGTKKPRPFELTMARIEWIERLLAAD